MPPRLAATLTVAVLTHNEAAGIEACLRSAPAIAEQLVVIDSGSSDDTVALARAAGAEVFAYPDWQGFAVQRTRQLQHARGDYVFFLDADVFACAQYRNRRCVRRRTADTQTFELFDQACFGVP